MFIFVSTVMLMIFNFSTFNFPLRELPNDKGINGLEEAQNCSLEHEFYLVLLEVTFLFSLLFLTLHEISIYFTLITHKISLSLSLSLSLSFPSGNSGID